MRRGQATLELALGALLTVTLIFGALYFGELTFIGMKVTEAGSFAVYEASGLRTHNFENPNDPRRIYRPMRAARTALRNGGEITSEYDDLDGMSDVTDGSGYQLGWTQTTSIVNQCAPDPSIGFEIPAAPRRINERGLPPYENWWRRARGHARTLFQDRGGFACSSRAVVESMNIPRNFMERGGENGFFRRDHWTAAPVTLCAFGRATNGRCGELGILVGDWSLGGPRSSRQNESVALRDSDAGPNGGRGPRRGNQPYYQMVWSMVRDNGPRTEWVSRGRAASRFATWANRDRFNLNESPHDESLFRMSYVGVDRGAPTEYQDYPFGPNGRQYSDVTSGVYDPDRRGTDAGGTMRRLRVRGGCFLGRGRANESCSR